MLKLASGGSPGQPSQKGDGQLRILSANISMWGLQAEESFGVLIWGVFRRWHSQSTTGCQQHLQNRKAVEAYWFHGSSSSKKTGNSIKGTSGGRCIGTRNHVAMAAWTMKKSDVSGARDSTGVLKW